MFSILLPTGFADEGMHFSLLPYCFAHTILPIFATTGRTSVSPMVCSLFFTIKQQTTKEDARDPSFSLVKFCEVLDCLSHDLKHC